MGHDSGIEEQLPSLIADGTDDVGMAVTTGRDGMAAVCVKPVIAVLVDEPGALAPHRANRELGVDRHEGRRTGGRMDGGIANNPFVILSNPFVILSNAKDRLVGGPIRRALRFPRMTCSSVHPSFCPADRLSAV
jgi:hypothetical protein